jgi:uncharacterized membrane protein
MFEDSDQLWWGLGYCAFMLILALLFRSNPPKKINHIYGYRTTRSMKNQKVWDASNTYSSGLMVRFCLFSFILPLIFYFLLPGWNFLLTVIGNTLWIVLIYFYTEKYLQDHFDEEGNQLK